MRIAKQPDEPAPRWKRQVLIGLVLAAITLLVIGVMTTLVLREDRETSPATATTKAESATVPSSTIRPRSEVAARLHEIFEVRDRAIESRNSNLLEEIYTVDCPCRVGDEQLIRRLRREGLVWRGIKVTLRIENIEKINDRLWTVNALVLTSPFEIEKESGEVVQRVPRGQEFSRFALAKPVGQVEWLLGHASVIDEDG